MDRLTLEKLIKPGEGFHLEFKKLLPEPEKLLREAVAFANACGGDLLLGVDDDGNLTGIKDPDEIAESFRNVAEAKCRPLPQYELELIPLTRKRAVLRIHVQESKIKPHQVFDTPLSKGRCYFRVEDRSIQASPELVQILRFQGRKENVKIEIGEKEKILLRHLGEQGQITLRDFAKLACISRFTASRTLVHLVKGNILRIEPREGEDLYLPAES